MNYWNKFYVADPDAAAWILRREGFTAFVETEDGTEILFTTASRLALALMGIRILN